MYHLIIAAWPESAAVVMVGQESEELDAAEVLREYAFLPQLVPTIKEVLAKFEEDPIEDCCVYGPKNYINRIAEEIQDVFPQLNVVTEEAGA